MKFQNHIGLDIGGSSVKLVQLAKEGDKFRLVALAISEAVKLGETPEGDVAISGQIKDLAKKNGFSSKGVVISLPESQIYTRVVEMPFMQEPDLSSAIKWQAEQYIPVALSDVVLKHQVLSVPETGVPDSKMSVLLVAAPNKLIERYVTLLAKAGLEALAIETEIFATARALVAQDAISPTTLLVNFGTDSTTLAVLKKGDLSLTQSITTGGMAMTRSLMANLNLEIGQAEEYKRVYGLTEGQLEGKVVSAVKPVVDLVLGEVKKVVAYYETRPGTDPIKRVVLSGATALMPGLVQYFTASLALEVQLGNPFNSVVLNDAQKKIVYEAGPVFAAAVGLAMKQT